MSCKAAIAAFAALLQRIIVQVFQLRDRVTSACSITTPTFGLRVTALLPRLGPCPVCLFVPNIETSCSNFIGSHAIGC